jgi:hypothetical protein
MKSKPLEITVRRLGGMLPTMRPSKTQSLDALDSVTLEELRAFVAANTISTSAAHPEAMSYQFELKFEDRTEKACASFNEIPACLHPFLPGPRDRS